jgi:hypothetical protein
MIDTNTTTMSIVYANTDPFLGNGFCAISVLVDGKPFAMVEPAGVGQVYVSAPISMPAGSKRVTIKNGGLNGILGGPVALAVFVPSSASFAFVPAANTPKLVPIGDSIASGASATWAGVRGMFQLLEPIYPGEIVYDVLGSQTLSGGYVYGTLNMPATGAAPPAVSLTGAPNDVYAFTIEITARARAAPQCSAGRATA